MLHNQFTLVKYIKCLQTNLQRLKALSSMERGIQKSDRLVKMAVKTFSNKICYKNSQNMYYGVSIESSWYSASIDTHKRRFDEEKKFRPIFLLHTLNWVGIRITQRGEVEFTFMKKTILQNADIDKHKV